MPAIAWNEIQNRAAQFAATWAGETYEKGESQSFWTEFLDVYGIDRRRQGALFEYSTKKLGGERGFIDLFWPGKLVAEQKSAGRNLDNAQQQANEYVLAMPDADLPEAIVVSDFATFRVYNLTTRTTVEFTLEDLPRHVRVFGFLVGQASKYVAEEDPVNRDAAEGMSRLHNRLEATRYTGRDLETLLVRLVFCLFADDAQIFERGAFREYVRHRTNVDGTDLGPRLVELFEVLDTPVEERQTTLDEELAAFPYVNGGLFAERIRTPSLTGAMRLELLAAAALNWAKVSPAIFGSMFQGVMDETERRNLGAHYTSERNILRVIKPLFLDDLYAEFDRVRSSRRELARFHDKLAGLTFLDPACGCGNFLVITYRELRRLEHKVVLVQQRGQTALDLRDLLRVNVDQLHGIEIEEFPALVAQTALWLTDHQMNLEASRLLGQTYTRLPLTASANIVHGNALTLDWAEVIPPERLTYILGNPPFVGKQHQSPHQKAQLASVFQGVSSAGELDFVSAWYGKALQTLGRNRTIQAALVSTNSIVQGEQVGILWKYLFDQEVAINFAHRTFQWTNEGRGLATVQCVIIGFGVTSAVEKHLFSYEDPNGEPIAEVVSRINGYLVDAPVVFLPARRLPICSDVPPMRYGSKPVDDGHYFLTDAERDRLLRAEPQAEAFIRRFAGAHEMLNDINRWCLWLAGIEPGELRRMPAVLGRVEKVRAYRAASRKEPTRRAALTPTLFAESRQPSIDYLGVPGHTSENRSYIPMRFFNREDIIGNSAFAVEGATLYHFGVLTSRMHMAWVRSVCGRLESRYRYSAGIVYNNFPWPEGVTEAQRGQVARLAQVVLDARALFSTATLADLYDPKAMPPALTKAHHDLDRAVDRLYRREPFPSDLERVELLFTEYQRLTVG